MEKVGGFCCWGEIKKDLELARRVPVPANPYENTTEESASELGNGEIPMDSEVDLDLQTSK